MKKGVLAMQFQQTDNKKPLEQFGRNLIEEVKKRQDGSCYRA